MSPSDNFGKKFKFPGKLRCSEQIEEFRIANIARLGSLKVSFVHEQRDIHTWLYVFLTAHITIRHILRKSQSMRSEPQNMGVVLRVITSKLLRLNQFYAPFPKN